MAATAGRILCAAIAVLVAVAPVAAAAGSPDAPVVFVCEKGVAKSLVAATLFEQRAKARGLDLRAVSRGMAPKPEVPTVVREQLGRLGRDVAAYRAAALTGDEAAGARRVVAFDVDVAPVVQGRAPIARWDGLPSVTQDYPAFEAAVLLRIDALLDELAPQRAPAAR